MSGTLEITTLIGCPVRCRYCPQAVLLDACQGMPRYMSFDTFRECLGRVPHEVRIDFSGMAEPWLNRDCRRMLQFAADRSHPLAMFTTLLGMKAADLDFLSQFAIDPIVFHFPDAEGNSPIPISPGYLTLVRHLVEVLLFAPGWRHVRISCHGTLHPRLRHEFGEHIAELRLPVIGKLVDRAGALHDAELPHYHTEGRIQCRTAGRRLNHNVLLPDGSVILCCMDYGCKHVLGNLLRQSYESLFAGAEMGAVITGLDNPSRPVVCRRCVRAIPLTDDDAFLST